ncbi:hypothetical protein E2562_010887 [Oryza meyeriana var. granulata]|uniref:Reverse transcriptase Ty1/copia-type domain-containing protein n=1 Tax=Oryza meyeriana var. granulata TaxID=110450 RepID=A0A6G1BUK0_9ORYZ|nr:hypothetical protein E2562_010887 [Oryza meyeriana var. granulata]
MRWSWCPSGHLLCGASVDPPPRTPSHGVGYVRLRSGPTGSTYAVNGGDRSAGFCSAIVPSDGAQGRWSDPSPLPPQHRTGVARGAAYGCGLKWVYKLKKDAQGVVVKHKARLVAKGYVQRVGVDFDEVFALFARLVSVRLLLAFAAQEGWMVHHMDVKFAFLNVELVEEVYVVQPPGFVVYGEENKVYMLDKALYGLRQAPRAWNTKLDATLKKIGFRQSPLEHGLYARSDGGGRLLQRHDDGFEPRQSVELPRVAPQGNLWELRNNCSAQRASSSTAFSFLEARSIRVVGIAAGL